MRLQASAEKPFAIGRGPPSSAWGGNRRSRAVRAAARAFGFHRATKSGSSALNAGSHPSRATQAGKSGSGRRRNVAAAFEVPAGRRKQVEGLRILLVDDVLTTGATAEGCARALKAAGAARVDLAVVARVQAAAGLTI